MNRTILAENRSETVSSETLLTVLKRLPRYIVCVQIGLIGGAAGVALVTTIAIAIQARWYSQTTFVPDITQFMVMAALLGLGVSWLLSRPIQRLFSNLFRNSNQRELQVVLVSSILMSLLQGLIFGLGF